jgi:hypothetical protein
MVAEAETKIGIESAEASPAGLDLLTTGGFDVVLLDLGCLTAESSTLGGSAPEFPTSQLWSSQVMETRR